MKHEEKRPEEASKEPEETPFPNPMDSLGRSSLQPKEVTYGTGNILKYEKRSRGGKRKRNRNESSDQVPEER